MRNNNDKNIDDILASLNEDDAPGEGFNRNYFQFSDNQQDNEPKPSSKKYQENKYNEPKNTNKYSNPSYNYPQKTKEEPQIDADLDWGDDKNDDFDDDLYKYDNKQKEYNNNDNLYGYSQPVDINKIASISNSLKTKKKCEITYLGNFLINPEKLCNNLLCTKCCVKVSIFKNKKWDNSVNYLFFRNNYSRKDMLETKLVDAYGTTCYSCQCNWKNITEDSIIAAKVSNWVCLGH